ncbi:DNA primase [Catenulispora sp. NF23]|uniref:DNA primase n=1 Tax=Catenulispora pinistramenti TaxID=2705254 RepID=UPI001BA575E3|nr:DNA primase [Catenulispora pinistramenti]MBS2535515.1 DNA primase [Catenulispora pinistramenti]
MAGRINDDDIERVRRAASIVDVVGAVVQLANAGGGNLKGLCPFHDEKSPSFQVSPAKNFYHCFGCGVGGDVIKFVMEYDHLSFTDSIERLAGQYNIELRYTEGGYTKQGERSERTRLLEAHKVAAEYFVDQLATPAAVHARELLSSRGFDPTAIERFRVGYAPESWEMLVRHLRARGFADKEILTSGLASEGRRGAMDRFRNRLMWPIADLSGDVIGFGGRRLTDDPDTPKYLNSPETPIYKKSSVLYGLDMARREIVKQERAVVVEGYTDVMACHLAGVPTAVATCGTAFGEDHIKMLRRLLADRNQFLGVEVVFTFDGDSAGQKAAMRAYLDEDKFVTQTFVAVEPNGMDPCDLRLAKGDAAVRELVATRTRLFEFVIRAELAKHNLDEPEGRMHALRATAPIVAKIRDAAMRSDYTRQLAGWLGMEEPEVRPAVRRLVAASGGRTDAAAAADAAGAGGYGAGGGRGGDWNDRRGNQGSNNRRGGQGGYGGGRGQDGPGGRGGGGRDGRDGGWGDRGGNRGGYGGNGGAGNRGGYGGSGGGGYGNEPAGLFGAEAATVPSPRDPVAGAEREALKMALQFPQLAGATFDGLAPEEFTVPAYAAVCAAVHGAGGCTAVNDNNWTGRIQDQAPDDAIRGLITELTVERVNVRGAADERYVAEVMTRVRIHTVDRRIKDVRSKLQRLNPVTGQEEYNKLFGELVALEQYKRGLAEVS